jgi:anti-anti-sigma factor
MKINSQSYNDVIVVELQGELIAEYVQQFKDAISETMFAKPSGIVLDMSKVGFIDSLGLEELLSLRDECNDKSCQLKLAGLDENCRKIFVVTRSQDQLDSYEELAEAVKSFV